VRLPAVVASGLLGLLALGGCGLKGPLYLPEKTGDVVVRPAAGATPPATDAGRPADTQPAAEPPAETPPPETDVEPEVAPPGDSGG
jgi:predicted small lipoprotein YifL